MADSLRKTEIIDRKFLKVVNVAFIVPFDVSLCCYNDSVSPSCRRIICFAVDLHPFETSVFVAINIPFRP